MNAFITVKGGSEGFWWEKRKCLLGEMNESDFKDFIVCVGFFPPAF